MAALQADRNPDATIPGAKIARMGTIAAALIGATASITVALVQSPAPAKPTSVSPSRLVWWPTTRDAWIVETINHLMSGFAPTAGVTSGTLASLPLRAAFLRDGTNELCRWISLDTGVNPATP